MQLSFLMGSNWFYAVLAGSYSEGFLSRGTIVTYLPPPFTPCLDYWAAALKVGASFRRSYRGPGLLFIDQE